MARRIGNHTVWLEHSPSILGWAAAGSKKEADGPLADQLDICNPDSTFGEKTWEKAESRMQREVVSKALTKCGLTSGQIDYIFAGDLLNQCISSNYGLRELGIPFLGLYGACSTMAESLSLAALLVEGGIARHCAAATSSHFCSAERQFRFPLEYGGQRAPTCQWTVTGAGACVLGESSMPPYVRAVTIGAIEDLGINDMNNMGAAMAPAAMQTLCRFFADTGTNADNYDAIFTGDRGWVGSQLLRRLMEEKGYHLGDRYQDCGLMIYDRETQQVDAGGSGCGCSAVVLCAEILQKIRAGSLREVLFIATGALMSPISVQQGETIPGIAHLVHLSNTPGC